MRGGTLGWDSWDVVGISQAPSQDLNLILCHPLQLPCIGGQNYILSISQHTFSPVGQCTCDADYEVPLGDITI